MANPSAVKLLVTDIDGVLTDGKLYLDAEGARELKSFHVQDGMGLLLAREAGMKTMFLSGRESGAIRKRGEELHVDHIVLGSKNKEKDLEEILAKEGLRLHNVCFIGDDVQDLPLLRKVGFSCAPSNAAPEVRKRVNYISEKNGGEGAVRDIVEHILQSKMGLQKVTEKLLSIEEELKPFGTKIAGEPFWELVRSGTRRKILGEVGAYSKKEPPRIQGLGYLWRVALHVLKSVLFRNPFLARKADVLFFGMYRRRHQKDGFWHDIYCDPLINELEREGIRCLMIERPPFGRPTPGPAKTRRLAHYDFIEVCAALTRRAGLFKVHLSQEETALLDTLQQRINAEFGISLNLRSDVIQTLEKGKSLLPFYRQLVRRASPRAVVAVNSAGHLQLVKACREAGIPLIELQQGALHRYMLEGPYEKGKEYVPDYFFTYGDFWKRFVALEPERVKSAGFPYYELESKKYLGTARKNSQVLFLSQPMVARQLSQFALELARELGDSWRVVYKLHPEESADWRARYASLAGSRVEVMADEDKPLYELFAESSAQVGVSSTALYEGLGFGLPTYLLEAPGAETMDALVETGSARLVSSAPELRELLLQKERQKPVEGGAFFQSGALERMVNSVKEIASL